MPAIDFPASPSVNQEYSFEGRTWLWNGTGWEVKSYPAALQLGSATAPSLYFTGDTNTGLYSPGADQVALTTAGAQKFTIDSLDGNAIIENNFPTIRPSLDLPFALTKTLDPRITFTRASSATYVDSAGLIQTASTDVPRFDHNPTTGESLGLLVEEARTNLLVRSEEFETGWAAAGGAVASAGTNVAPNGTATADTITDTNGTTASPFIFQTVTLADSTTYTMSCYLKAGTKSTARVGIRNKAGSIIFSNFDLAAGTTSVGSAISSSIESVGNGWYRCIVVAGSSTGATSQRGLIYIDTASYTADGTGTILAWGAQLEAGAFPTSYIPTTTATVTRSADVASITGSNFSNWYRQEQGTVFAEYRTPASGTRGVVGFNNNTADERVALFTSGTDPKLIVVDGGVTQADLDGGAVVASTMAKTAAAFAANDFSIVHAGGTAVTDTGGTMPTPDRIFIGADQAGNYQNGRTKRVMYWPLRLPNSTLQALTA